MTSLRHVEGLPIVAAEAVTNVRAGLLAKVNGERGARTVTVTSETLDFPSWMPDSRSSINDKRLAIDSVRGGNSGPH
jgi:hypothetical protein